MQAVPNSHTPVYTISTVAELLGVSVHTIRMYEREGLIIPYKKESNQRLYSNEDVERLRCIRKAINGDKISIEGIKRIISLIPCWAIVRCPEEERSKCPAYFEGGAPCWMLKKMSGYCGPRECRECEVYQEASDCSAIKGQIKSLLQA